MTNMTTLSACLKCGIVWDMPLSECVEGGTFLRCTCGNTITRKWKEAGK